MIARIRAALAAYVERNTDHAPEYSRLDLLDGLGR